MVYPVLKEIGATMPECVQVVALDGQMLQSNAPALSEGRQELSLQEVNELLERKIRERTRDLEAALG